MTIHAAHGLKHLGKGDGLPHPDALKTLGIEDTRMTLGGLDLKSRIRPRGSSSAQLHRVGGQQRAQLGDKGFGGRDLVIVAEQENRFVAVVEIQMQIGE
jgi:hypothetical protein